MEHSTIDTFDQVYATYVETQPTVLHHRLRPILLDVMTAALSPDLDRERLVSSLERLSSFLGDGPGRTTPHLQAVDRFFCDVHDLWRPLADHLPSDILNVIDTIGMDLHGGIDQPEFHTTPEQLAEMVRGLKP